MIEIGFSKTEYIDTGEDATQNLEINEDTLTKGCDKYKFVGFLITKRNNGK